MLRFSDLPTNIWKSNKIHVFVINVFEKKNKRIKKIKQDISQKIKKNYMIDFSQAVDHIACYSTVVCFVYSAL